LKPYRNAYPSEQGLAKQKLDTIFLSLDFFVVENVIV